MLNIEKVLKRSYFLTIKIRVPGIIPLVFPIPLGFLEDLFESIEQVCWLGMKIAPRRWKNKWKWKSKRFEVYFDLANYYDLPLELIKELRKLGRFTLVEVKDEDAHVSIKFY